MKIDKIFFVLLILVFKTLNANAINIEYGYLDKPQCSMKGTEYIYVGNILTSKKNYNEAFEKIKTEIEKKSAYDGHIKVTPDTAGLVITPDPKISVSPIHIQTQFSFDIYTQMAQKMRLQNPNKDPWPEIIALHYLTKASKLALEYGVKKAIPVVDPVITTADLITKLVLKKSISAFFDLSFPGKTLDKIRVSENNLQVEYDARVKTWFNDPLFKAQIEADTNTMNNVRNLIEKKLVNEKKKVFVIAHGVGSMYVKNAVNAISANQSSAVPYLNNVFALLSVGKDAGTYSNSNTVGKYRTIASIEGIENAGGYGIENYVLESKPATTNGNEMLDIYLSTAQGIYKADYNGGSRNFRPMRHIFFEQIKDMNLELADNCPSPVQPVITLGEIPSKASPGAAVQAIATVTDEENGKGVFIWKQTYKIQGDDGKVYQVTKQTEGAVASLSADYPGQQSVSVIFYNEFGRFSSNSKSYIVAEPPLTGGILSYRCPFVFLSNSGVLQNNSEVTYWLIKKLYHDNYIYVAPQISLRVEYGESDFTIGPLGNKCKLHTSCPAYPNAHISGYVGETFDVPFYCDEE